MTKSSKSANPAPSWHELVQPPSGAARADRWRTRERRRQLGQLVEVTVTVDPPPHNGPNRAARRAVHGRGWNPGRLVRHSPRAAHVQHVDAHSPVGVRSVTACGSRHAVLPGQERTSTLMRGLRRRIRWAR